MAQSRLKDLFAIFSIPRFLPWDNGLGRPTDLEWDRAQFFYMYKN